MKAKLISIKLSREVKHLLLLKKNSTNSQRESLRKKGKGEKDKKMLIKHSKNLKPIQIRKKPSLLWFTVASMFSMFLGSQAVHFVYKPLENLNQLVEEEFQKLLREKEKTKTSNS